MRVADVEGAGRVVGAVGEELERGGRALDALHGGAPHHPRRQVFEHLEADALGHVIERLLHQRRIVRRRHQRRRKYAGRSVETNGFPPTTLTSVPSGVAMGRNWISLLAS